MNLVKQSLYLCIGTLLVLIALIGGQSLWQASRIADAADAIVASDKASSTARDLWSRFLETEKAFRQATAFTDAASADALRKAFADQAARLGADVAALRAGVGPELAPGADAASAAVQAWLALAAPHLASEGVTELPSYHRLDAARSTLEGDIGALVTRSAAAAEAAVAARHTIVRTTCIWTIAELVLAVALGVALGWHALRSLHRQLGADASEVARVANAVADGDLTVPIRADALPEGSVMAATARMQRSLMETVERVRTISADLFAGANEIATGNNDLSQRTEAQATALVKAAATMEQLGITVRQNADHASEANRLAERATEVARTGGNVVDSAVETMRGINDSSKKIAEIIGVIDGIAFQTNILALNAAVEAARAGEQGRGFAVVAGEVRSLAQRSASAAREIKALIVDSVARIERGSSLVDRAGHQMTEVVTSIQRVNGVMAQIHSASAEQSSGVSQVGEAVTELDHNTQRNAALAQQSAAASENLKTQGQRLVDAVSFFKLGAAA